MSDKTQDKPEQTATMRSLDTVLRRSQMIWAR